MKKLDEIKFRVLTSLGVDLDNVLEAILKEAYSEGFNDAMEYYIQDDKPDIMSSFSFEEFINKEVDLKY